MSLHAAEISGIFYRDIISVDESVFINAGAAVSANQVRVTDSVDMVNDGYFYAENINLCRGCVLRLVNSGVWNAGLTMASGARVIQVINSANEITDVGKVNGLEICTDDIVSADKISEIVHAPEYVLLRDAHLDIGTGGVDFGAEIILSGEVRLYMADGVALNAGALMYNVSGAGAVSVHVDGLDALHAVQTSIVDGNLYGHIVRETDYLKIFKDNAGVFLNELRQNMPNDGLLVAMDTASSVEELQHIMSHSVRLRPQNMLQPIRQIGALTRADVFNVANMPVGGVYGVMFAESWRSDFVRARAEFRLDKHTMLFAHFGTGEMEYADDINKFSAAHYGVGIGGVYSGDRWVARAVADAVIADFDVGAVFDGAGTVFNPYGVSANAVAEIGRQLHVINNLDIVPFAGLTSWGGYILDAWDFDVLPHVGAEFNMSAGTSDFEYDYIFRTRLDTNGGAQAAVAIGANMPADGIAVDVSVGVVRDDFSYALSVGAGVRIDF